MRDPASVPVLVILFNRPDKVAALMQQLATIRPARLYIAADGPRSQVPTDTDRCTAARTLAQEPSWPCEVHTRFSEVNQGVDPAVEAAITWFFEHEPEGVILEDDCMPSSDFMTFAYEMLERYRTDTTVMMISGNNFQDGIRRGDSTYYFSHYPNTWGWATWRRAWEHYDTSLAALPKLTKLDTIRPFKDEQRYWVRYFRKLRAGIYSAWDAKWVFAIWNAGGVCITPNMNLVQNIGFDADATHTIDDAAMRIEVAALDTPMRHPATITVSDDADRYLFLRNYRVSFMSLVRHHIRKLFV